MWCSSPEGSSKADRCIVSSLTFTVKEDRETHDFTIMNRSSRGGEQEYRIYFISLQLTRNYQVFENRHLTSSCVAVGCFLTTITRPAET